MTLWCCVYTKPDSTGDSTRPRGGSTGSGEGGDRPPPRRLLTKKIETLAWVIQCALLFTHRLSGFTKTHQSVYATQWPKPVSIQFICTNSIRNAPKLAFLSSKIENIFWGGGTTPSILVDPRYLHSPPPSHTPSGSHLEARTRP